MYVAAFNRKSKSTRHFLFLLVSFKPRPRQVIKVDFFREVSRYWFELFSATIPRSNIQRDSKRILLRAKSLNATLLHVAVESECIINKTRTEIVKIEN